MIAYKETPREGQTIHPKGMPEAWRIIKQLQYKIQLYTINDKTFYLDYLFTHVFICSRSCYISQSDFKFILLPWMALKK